MEIKTFIKDFGEAFTDKAELPVAIWYSDKLEGEFRGSQGCMFKVFGDVRKGTTVSMNESIGCGGGKFFCGFAGMADRTPNFVSLKEKYIKTPEMFKALISEQHITRATKKYIHFARIDQLESFDGVEALIFLATPDVLSGLATWAFFDNPSPNAVTTPFGSGCDNTITHAVKENKMSGRSCFIGMFDPSARMYFEKGIVSFTIPMSRFKEMCETMHDTFLFDTYDWGKVKKRISGEEKFKQTYY